MPIVQPFLRAGGTCARIAWLTAVIAWGIVFAATPAQAACTTSGSTISLGSEGSYTVAASAISGSGSSGLPPQEALNADCLHGSEGKCDCGNGSEYAGPQGAENDAKHQSTLFRNSAATASAGTVNDAVFPSITCMQGSGLSCIGPFAGAILQ